MDIAILGGTGDFGEGLAARWTVDSEHDVIVGSRDAERARAAAERYERRLRSLGADGTIGGAANPVAAERADVVVAAVPAYHLAETIDSVAGGLDAETVLVSPAVGMKRDEEGMHYNRPGTGSVTALAADAAPDEVPVVGAFHSLPAGRLADLERDLAADTLVVGDDDTAVERTVALADAIEGVRAHRAGPLANAAEVETVTPLLINLETYNDHLQDTVVRFK